MSGGAILLAVALPLALAPLAAVRRLRGLIASAAPLAPVPALLLALLAPDTTVDGRLELPWVLTGTALGLDATGRTFLLLTAFLWGSAGLFARAYLAEDPASPRFFGFHLAALAGNVGLILAQDAVSFYLFFALMTFAAYGLVVHDGTPAAHRAGRIYVVLAIAGEMLLLAGLFLAVGVAGSTRFEHLTTAVAASPVQGTIVPLLLTGFGVKAGMIVLHVWLPIAHPVAPTPASAVLSGAMIKAGLLGWLRFLPLGQAAVPGWGPPCVVAGFAAVFAAAALGLVQRDAKTILAYSSVSQMGFITVGVGVGLAVPESWTALSPALALYALHHGLAKGALFLGVGVVRAIDPGRAPWVLLGLGLPALALGGAPFTGGAAAKLSLKRALDVAGAWGTELTLPLALGAAGTTVLMARFLVVARSEAGESEAAAGTLVAPWVLTMTAVAAAAWVFAPDAGLFRYSLTASALWGAAWPVLAAALVAGSAARWLRVRLPPIPPGDVLALLEPLPGRMLASACEASRRALIGVPATSVVPAVRSRWSRIATEVGRLETRVRGWNTTGPVLLMVAAALLALLALG
jgi:formate hydrogenlyase subunit 3/multisubunit Na+/H+ antiporter MnhD subunit